METLDSKSFYQLAIRHVKNIFLNHNVFCKDLQFLKQYCQAEKLGKLSSFFLLLFLIYMS